MWRSSTDTLQVWSRVMVQQESLVGLGAISGPGQWGFGDCLELGVPGSLPVQTTDHRQLLHVL